MVAPPYLPVPPPGYGGTERVVAAQVEGLVAAGHDVTLFAAAGSTGPARLVVPLPAPPVLGDLSAVYDELHHVGAAYHRADSFDVIHDHTGTGVALGAVLRGGPPVVHTLHGPWTDQARRLLGPIDRKVHLVAISRSQRQANPDVRYAGMVHNGIDLAAHPYQPRKDGHLVFVGRISPDKGPEVAVEVARRSGRPLVMLIKRTEPPERDYWDRVVAPLLHSGVEVFDEPSQDLKVELMGGAAALLFPIRWPEPFGLVMAEAMACGTPVIASPLGAASEIVVHAVTGFLCRTVDEMVAAATVAGRLRPADCRAHVERHFSAQAMVAGYTRIYRTVTGFGSRPPEPVSTLVAGGGSLPLPAG